MICGGGRASFSSQGQVRTSESPPCHWPATGNCGLCVWCVCEWVSEYFRPCLPLNTPHCHCCFVAVMGRLSTVCGVSSQSSRCAVRQSPCCPGFPHSVWGSLSSSRTSEGMCASEQPHTCVALFYFSERGGKHWYKRETSVGCLLHSARPGLNLQPRRVPWLGIEPLTFQFAGWHRIKWATLARACVSFV